MQWPICILQYRVLTASYSCTTAVESGWEDDLRKRSLALDIRNMFNELCRLCAQEDLLESGELVGVDLTLMARYVDIAYNCTPGVVLGRGISAAELRQRQDSEARAGRVSRWHPQISGLLDARDSVPAVRI
jgi:hypothetical protein